MSRWERLKLIAMTAAASLLLTAYGAIAGKDTDYGGTHSAWH